MKQFEESLASTESAFKEAQAEAKTLAKQTLEVERAIHTATEEIQASLLHCVLHALFRVKEDISSRLYNIVDRAHPLVHGLHTSYSV